MPFIKELNKDFYIKDGRIVLSEQYMKDNAWRFKKLTATKFSSVCGSNEFSGPLKTWCQMVGIYYEDMTQLIAKAGQVIEPKIRDFVSKKLNIKFKDYVPAEVKWDVFHKEDKKEEAERILGGIPDGEALDENGNVVHDKNHPILEIKTMGIDKFLYKKEKGVWVLQFDENKKPIIKAVNLGKESHFKDGKLVIPMEYQYQLALYLYLRHATTGMFAVCFITTEDYLHPEDCKVEERDIRLVKFEINESMIKPSIEYAEKWYRTYIKGGYSPLLTDKDQQWLKEVELIK